MLKRTPIRKVRSKPRRGRVKGKEMEALRREVFDRDCYRCQHQLIAYSVAAMCNVLVPCGKPVTWETGHLAHIVSRGAGGHDTAENTYCCCSEHHIAFHRNGPFMQKPCPPKPIG